MEENLGESVSGHQNRKKCFGQDLQSVENKNKNKLYVKLKTLHTAKDTIIGVKR